MTPFLVHRRNPLDKKPNKSSFRVNIEMRNRPLTMIGNLLNLMGSVILWISSSAMTMYRKPKVMTYMTLLFLLKKVKTIKRKWPEMFVKWVRKSDSKVVGMERSFEKGISYTLSSFILLQETIIDFTPPQTG